MPSFLATSHSNKLPSTATGNVTAETQILGSDGNLLILPIEGSYALQTPGNYRKFRVTIGGYATSGTTAQVTLKMYLGTSTTIASNGTAVIGPQFASLASGSHNFFITIDMSYDTVSKIIEGIYYGQAVSTLINLTAITTTSTGSFSDLSESQGFTLTAIFGSSNASNTLVISQFELEPL
jgi:hypothetical protein